MVFYAEAVLGEDFHQTQEQTLRALIESTTGRAQSWSVKSVIGDPAVCITEEAEAQNAALLVMGIHHHGAFGVGIMDNLAQRLLAGAAYNRDAELLVALQLQFLQRDRSAQ